MAVHNVVQLPISDKLKIIECLINQLLTYADVRDTIEERLEQSKQKRMELRSAQAAERRREQEYLAAKIKLKRESKQDPNLANELENLKKSADKKRIENERKIEKLLKTLAEGQVVIG